MLDTKRPEYLSASKKMSDAIISIVEAWRNRNKIDQKEWEMYVGLHKRYINDVIEEKYVELGGKFFECGSDLLFLTTCTYFPLAIIKTPLPEPPNQKTRRTLKTTTKNRQTTTTRIPTLSRKHPIKPNQNQHPSIS